MSIETEQPSLQETIAALADMPPLEYEQVREAKAQALNIRKSALDKEVAKHRATSENEQRAEDIVETLDPWSEPVTGSELADTIADTLNRHIVLPPGAANAVTLWALGSYCMDVWRLWPKLLITSPQKRCGKSTLLEVIEATICRALLVSNISPTAIFRCIEAFDVSLLIDEADTFTRDNDELNGIVNSGHTKRTARVVRNEKIGEEIRPKAFSTWSPQVIAGIGEQRGTLHDRSIHIEMQRKLQSERTPKLPIDFFEAMLPVRRKCLRWSQDNLDTLRLCTISPPDCGNDRAQDNWTPLFAIAETLGGDWPEHARAAYEIFSEISGETDDAGIMLLGDIKQIFEDWKGDKIPSARLVEKLVEMEDRPWFEWKRGKALTQNTLSRLLKPYHVIPGTIRIGNSTPKGYRLESFKPVFERYLDNDQAGSPAQTATNPGAKSMAELDQKTLYPQKTPIQTATTPQRSCGAGSSDFQSATSDPVLRFEKPLKAKPGAGCGVVAVQNRDIGEDMQKTGNTKGDLPSGPAVEKGRNMLEASRQKGIVFELDDRGNLIVPPVEFDAEQRRWIETNRVYLIAALLAQESKPNFTTGKNAEEP